MAVELILLSRVAHRGREIITGPRLRALLATDLRPGAGAARLVESLWPDDRPDNPTRAVAVLVSRARAQLGADVIVTTPAGYRLALDDEQVDAAALVHHAAAAARHARAGDHAAALADADAVSRCGTAPPTALFHAGCGPCSTSAPTSRSVAARWTPNCAATRSASRSARGSSRPGARCSCGGWGARRPPCRWTRWSPPRSRRSKPISGPCTTRRSAGSGSTPPRSPPCPTRSPRRSLGWARVPWSAVGAEGEATANAEGVTVPCLVRPDGTVPDDEDEPGLVALLSRAY